VKKVGTDTISLARQMLQQSAAVYRGTTGICGQATLEVSIPPSAEGRVSNVRTDTNSIEYALGEGTDASFYLDGYGAVALGDRAYLMRSDRPGVYAAVGLLRDLPTTMKAVLGSAMFVPPQIAMRAGHDVEAIIDAMGLGLIPGLVPVGFQTLDGKDCEPKEEIEFRGNQGSLIACFSTETASLLSLKGSIGSTRLSYVFHGETIVPQAGAVCFDAKGRTEVPSFSGVVGGPAVVGVRAPDFTLDTLDGPPRSVASAIGRQLVIDFWALWCGPCVGAMHELDALSKRLAGAAEPVAVWTVAIVEGGAEAGILEQIRHMWAAKGLTLPVLIDRDGLVSQSYGVKALPTTVVVDQRGIVELMETGLDPGKLEKLISCG
jgi:thiol-disulfide isomerase/thioredoxin